MKPIVTLLLVVTSALQTSAQESVFIGNFYQLGTIPYNFDSTGKNLRLNANTVVFNLALMKERTFFRADLSWLMRRWITGEPDTLKRDTILNGLDLPVFSFTLGRNFYTTDGFSIGAGINFDTRSYFNTAGQDLSTIVGAYHAGFIIGTKIRLHKKLTYTGFWGYDFLFTGNQIDAQGKGNIYASNNFSYKIYKSLAVNVQPDISFKTFRENGKQKVTQFSNRNIKFGIAFLID